jgi:hypothetical protein
MTWAALKMPRGSRRGVRRGGRSAKGSTSSLRRSWRKRAKRLMPRSWRLMCAALQVRVVVEQRLQRRVAQIAISEPRHEVLQHDHFAAHR